MRILSLCANLDRGGTQRVVQNFTLGYRRAGHDVAVMAWHRGGIRQQRLEQAGVQVIVGPDEAAIAAARAFGADVIHIHRAGVRDDQQNELMRRLKQDDCRIVETSVFSRVDRSEGSQLIDVHFQLTDWCMWKWRRWLARERDKHAGVVVPNPIDADAFPIPTPAQTTAFRQRHDIPSDAYLCGRVSQDDPSKWHPVNLSAFVDLARIDANAYLVLVGLSASYQPLVDAMPPEIKRRVRLLPLADDDRFLAALYGSLDCFLHAARVGESFGLVLAEAMLCGAPVVTLSRPFKDNGQIEVVENGIDGLVAGSVKTFSAATKSLWQNSELRQRARAGARQRVIDRYGVDRMCARALRVMEHALKHKDRKSLIDALGSDPLLKTEVSDAQAMRMLQNTVGGPSFADVARMHLILSPLVQRAMQLYLRLTFYRKIRKQFAEPKR